MTGISIFRAGPDRLYESWAIVTEYYEAVGVVAREDLSAFARLYFGDGSGFWLASGAGNVVGCIALKPLDRFPASAETSLVAGRSSSTIIRKGCST